MDNCAEPWASGRAVRGLELSCLDPAAWHLQRCQPGRHAQSSGQEVAWSRGVLSPRRSQQVRVAVALPGTPPFGTLAEVGQHSPGLQYRQLSDAEGRRGLVRGRVSFSSDVERASRAGNRASLFQISG